MDDAVNKSNSSLYGRLDLGVMTPAQQREYTESIDRVYDDGSNDDRNMNTWRFGWLLHDLVVSLRVADYEVGASSTRVHEAHVQISIILDRVEVLLGHARHLRHNVGHLTANPEPIERRIWKTAERVRDELVGWQKAPRIPLPRFGELFDESQEALVDTVRLLLTNPRSFGWLTSDDEMVGPSDLVVDKAHQVVRWKGKPIHIAGGKRFKVLEVLCGNPGGAVPIAEIGRKVWGTSDVSRNKVEAHVSRIRKCFKAADVTDLDIRRVNETYSLIFI